MKNIYSARVLAFTAFFFLAIGDLPAAQEYRCLMKAYSGTIGTKRINLVINQASYNSALSMKGTLSGYNTVGTNTRPVTGTFKLVGKGSCEIYLTEPGDNKYDGKFVLRSVCYNDGVTRVLGTWECYQCDLIKKISVASN